MSDRSDKILDYSLSVAIVMWSLITLIWSLVFLIQLITSLT